MSTYQTASLPPAILFRDNRFLVINKPPGLPVYAGRAGGPSVEDFFPAWRVGRNGPWLAHRLDRDTSGCLLIALRKSALHTAQDLFVRAKVEKTYWAIVDGVPQGERGVIDLPLGKATTGNRWKIVVDQNAGKAITSWAVKGRGDGIAWIAFTPATGRTHQIRAHASLLQLPIAGDDVYGRNAGGKLCLLARAIHVPLDPPVTAQAPIPHHMMEKMQACGYHGQE